MTTRFKQLAGEPKTGRTPRKPRARTAATRCDPLHETRRLLALLTAQLGQVADNNDRTFADLADIHTRLHEYALRQAGTGTNTEIPREISRMVVTLQFHDRVSQQIAHLVAAADAATQLLDDKRQRLSPDAWDQLWRDIKATYTTDEEHDTHSRTLQQTNDTAGDRDNCGNGSGIELF